MIIQSKFPCLLFSGGGGVLYCEKTRWREGGVG